jgi:hypothetical protein
VAAGILETIGQPVSESEIAQHMPGYLKYELRQLEKLRRNRSDSPHVIVDMMQELIDCDRAGEISWSGIEGLASLGISVAEKKQAGATYVGAAVACCAEMGTQGGRVEEWLSALEKMGTSHAAWCLNALAEWPMPEAVLGRARAGAEKLAAAGMKAKSPSVRGKYSHATLTACDGMGSRSVAFFRETSNHRLDALNLMLNDLVGIKDVLYLSGNGEDVEDYFRNNRIEYRFVEANFAGELVADAMAKHQALRTSPPWRLFPALPSMEGCDIRPAARTPNLGPYVQEHALRTPELPENSSRLADFPLYGCFMPDTDEAYQFCRRFANTHGATLPPGEFERFVREVAVKDRENLLHRMALNLEFESLAGRAHIRKNSVAARTWFAVRDGAVPFWEIPYVRELSRRAVERILENIRHGYFSRRQAFEVAREMGAKHFKPSAHTLMDKYEWLNGTSGERLTLADELLVYAHEGRLHTHEDRDPMPKPSSGHPTKKHGQKPKPRKEKVGV